MNLLELYDVSEMARTRGDPSWAVLDWAAHQSGDFTIRDAYRVYIAAGGESNEHQFATIFNKWVAKYDPMSHKDRYRDQGRYGLSQNRPLVITRSGRRGKGGAATYQWGLDAPLRQPPEGGVVEPEQDEVGDALDRLEGYMGGIELKKRMTRWRTLPDMNSVVRDVMTLPARFHAPALLVASQHLVSAGQVNQGEVDDMEARLDAKANQAPTGTPFNPGKPRTDLQLGRGAVVRRPAPVQAPQPEPEPEPEPEAGDDPSAEWADDEGDRTQPDAVSPFAEEEPETATEPEGAGGEEAGDEDEYDPQSPEGTELRVIMRSNGALSVGKATWRRGRAVVTDESGREVRPNKEIELQPVGDEQFEPEYEGLMMSLEGEWPRLLNPPSEGGPDLESEMGGEGTEDEEPQEAAGQYPEWVPYADDEGTPAEQAMRRLYDSGVVPPDDPLWERVAQADGPDQLRSILMKGWGSRPKQSFRDMLAVASHGLDNAFEPAEDDDAASEYEDEPVEDEGAGEESEEDPEGPQADEPEPPARPNSNRFWASVPDWLPRPDWKGPTLDVDAMQDILTDMPKVRGFEGFDGSNPIFGELRASKNIDDAYSVLMRRGVPKIMFKKFLRVTRAIFEKDGRDPDTGKRIGEGVARIIGMLEAAAMVDCEEDPVPDPSKRGPAGVGRLLPMYGMDEGPNTDPVDFAPKSGLSRIMRVVGRGSR